MKIILFLNFVLGMDMLLGATALKYAELTPVNHINPYLSSEAGAQRISSLVFERLITQSIGGQYEPSLAKSWTVGKSGTEVTIRLKDGVKWHNGQDFTSDDVVTTIRLLTAQKSEIPNKYRFDQISNARAHDQSNLTITLSKASSDPLKYLMFRILPSHQYNKLSHIDRINLSKMEAIGTGPFMVQSIGKLGTVKLTAFKSHHSGEPKIASLRMDPFIDQNVMAQSLMFNSIDLAPYISPRNLAEISGSNDISLLPYDALSYSFIGINTSREFLNDKRVRQAISYGTNKEEMLKAFFNGKGTVITGPFPPTSWAYNLDINDYLYDPKRSRVLINDAGYFDRDGDGYVDRKDGKPVELTFVVPITGENETIKRIVLTLQDYMKKIGVKIELKYLNWPLWYKTVIDNHDYDLTLASWSFDDAANITSLFHSRSARPGGNNFVQYRNPKIDGLLGEAYATVDFDKKRAIYHKIHALIADDAPYVFLWTLTHHAAYNSRISNVSIQPFDFFHSVGTWSVSR